MSENLEVLLGDALYALEGLRRQVTSDDQSREAHFKKFNRSRNAAYDALAALNEGLHQEQGVSILPELLQDEEQAADVSSIVLRFGSAIAQDDARQFAQSVESALAKAGIFVDEIEVRY